MVSLPPPLFLRSLTVALLPPMFLGLFLFLVFFPEVDDES